MPFDWNQTGQGLAANRPTNGGYPGRTYYSTDTLTWDRWDGLVWRRVAGPDASRSMAWLQLNADLTVAAGNAGSIAWAHAPSSGFDNCDCLNSEGSTILSPSPLQAFKYSFYGILRHATVNGVGLIEIMRGSTRKAMTVNFPVAATDVIVFPLEAIIDTTGGSNSVSVQVTNVTGAGNLTVRKVSGLSDGSSIIVEGIGAVS